MADCPYFQTYESGQTDQAPACGWDITKVVMFGGELVCKTVDPAGDSLCKKVDVGGMQVSPAHVVASVAGAYLVWVWIGKLMGSR